VVCLRFFGNLCSCRSISAALGAAAVGCCFACAFAFAFAFVCLRFCFCLLALFGNLLTPVAFVCLRFLGTCFRVGLLARRYARQQSLSLLLQRK
jgi:hypothetical protein